MPPHTHPRCTDSPVTGSPPGAARSSQDAVGQGGGSRGARTLSGGGVRQEAVMIVQTEVSVRVLNSEFRAPNPHSGARWGLDSWAVALWVHSCVPWGDLDSWVPEELLTLTPPPC
ncbi:protein Wnt-11b-like [Platysternon megacephalum]|uniref:Protein Wnt-11b-like n=1 Tax=Platysternon megacephalum TaxID=55544 RepID=A0A4D9DNF1_9SAUR|nr:protein Wnt-11b-like [Platysternon megacephalum]